MLRAPGGAHLPLAPVPFIGRILSSQHVLKAHTRVMLRLWECDNKTVPYLKKLIAKWLERHQTSKLSLGEIVSAQD